MVMCMIKADGWMYSLCVDLFVTLLPCYSIEAGSHLSSESGIFIDSENKKQVIFIRTYDMMQGGMYVINIVVKKLDQHDERNCSMFK